MIIDIPTSEELRERADALVHLAFSIGMKLHHDQREEWAEGVEPEARDEYWARCRPALANALSLVQQAHELYLKSKIAAVSPFLIIAREPHQWPKDAAKRDISFSEFLTVGAAELPRLHDTVCATRLDATTHGFLQKVREQRNAFVHMGATPSSRAGEVIELVLETHHWVYPDTRWFAARMEYLGNDHISALYSTDHVTAELHGELGLLRDLLSPSKLKRWLGADKKALWFNCARCLVDMGDYGDAEPTAQLRSADGAEWAACMVCDYNTAIERRKCRDPDCACTVHASDNQYIGVECLHCRADENFKPYRVSLQESRAALDELVRQAEKQSDRDA